MTGEEPKGLGEFAAIARTFKPLAGNDPVARGLDDDAAVLTPPAGHDLVFTKDAMVAGVHFFADDPKDLVARKLARVNLSDLAAMGARPLGYLLAAALPDEGREDWLQALATGLGADQEEFGWSLWGGDTVSTPGPATLSLTAIGAVASGQALSRAGARAGDLVFVSGTVGDGGLGLLALTGRLQDLEADAIAALTDRFLLPTPRLALGQALVGTATAAIDISDGLFADLGHICEASGLGAEVYRDSIPLSPAARAAINHDPALWPHLFQGDDYELLVTIPPEARDMMADIARSTDVALTEIGVMVAGIEPRLLNGSGEVVPGLLPGYRHF